MQVLWDAGMSGAMKVDVISAASLDKQLMLMCFPQAGVGLDRVEGQHMGSLLLKFVDFNF